MQAGANLLGSNPRMALTGRHVTSSVLEELGFQFDEPTFDQMLQRLP